MKKIAFIAIGLIFSISLGAQTLEEIVKKNYDASKYAAYEKVKTLTMEMKAYQQGMEMAMTTQMKKPDKVRITISVQGMEIIQTFDGTEGYMLNPMMGSSVPVALPAADAAKLKDQSNFNTPLMEYFKDGKLELAGDATVSGNSAWKLKATLPTGDVNYIYIDKSSGMTVKQDAVVSQGGMELSIETYMTDYTEYGGILFPKTITSYSNGTEIITMMVTKVEVDKPMDDSLFTLKK